MKNKIIKNNISLTSTPFKINKIEFSLFELKIFFKQKIKITTIYFIIFRFYSNLIKLYNMYHIVFNNIYINYYEYQHNNLIIII